MAPIAAATGEILKHYRRARSSVRETIDRPGTWLWRFLDGATNHCGYEAMAMIRKGQARNIGGRDIKAQAEFIAGLFQVAA